ncbi:DMT family transporter [Granulosicoccaceae sp. 1_MG-2023]|nr:DMT family transporter [Granulosicoccaceae sp. 1_MG-2023]
MSGALRRGADPRDRLSGVLMMLLGMATLSSMDATVKWLVMQGLPVMELMALRGWLIVALILLLTLPRGRLHELATRRLSQHLLRGMIGFAAPLCFFTAVKTLPLADVTAIFFCAAFFMTAGAALFLHEPVGPARWLAVACGFAGVVLIIRPDSSGWRIDALLPVAGAAAYAVLMLWGRALSGSETTRAMLFWINLAFAVLATAGMLTEPFIRPDLTQTAVIALSAVLGLGGFYFVTRAFTLAPLPVIAPLEYTSLIWALILGYFLWGDWPAPVAWLGIAIVVGSGLIIVYREHRARRHARAAQAAENHVAAGPH